MASRTRTFFVNGLSLTVSAILMRAIAMLFSAIVASRAGSEAMGLYSLLGSVYTFSITLATAGIGLGTTRLVSDALGLADEALARKAVKNALGYCIITGGAATILLFSLSDVIGIYILGDERAILPLRILSLTLIPIAVCSCLSGYFNAVRRVRVNATCQVASQLTRIGFTVLLLSLLVEKGTEMACVALVLGGAISELISLLLSFVLYRIDLHKLSKGEVKDEKGIIKKLMSITLPVTLSATVRSLLSMLQQILVPRGLKASGKSWEASLSSYGSLHGMAMPLILFPSAFTSAFSGLLIPEVSECIVTGNYERLKRVSYRSLTLSLCFSIGISGIMLFFSRELGLLIFGNEETADYIRIMAPLIPVMYIDSNVDAILKGSGHQVYSMNVNIADTLTACLFAIFLIPKMGIWGYIISIYATEILNTTLSLYKMFSITRSKPKVIHQVLLPTICVIGATNLSKLILSLVGASLSQWIVLLICIAITTAIYVLFLFMTGAIGKEEKEFLSAALLGEKKYNLKYKIIQ